ncbi:MAG: GntR family transcriptional regulator [Rhodobacteraceae bacterium]|nr:GntR family transcriptional regulator [Paracoccaceae bacterium]
MAAQLSEIQVYVLREIVEGRLSPGDRIDEAAITTRFGVSKTPIREAILQLEARGVVEKRPRAGAAVAGLTPEELIEFLELHSELEGAAAYHAARRATPSQLQALEDAAGAYEAQVAAGAQGTYDLNLAFHLAVFACCNNNALQLELNMTGVRLVAYFRAQEGLRTGTGTAVDEHRDIVRAIREGRADDARAAMRQHAEISSDILLDVLALMKA